MRRQIAQLPRSARLRLALAVTLGLGAAGATIIQAVLLGQIIARMFSGHVGLGALSSYLALLLAAILARAVLLWGRETQAKVAALQARTRLRERLLRHIVRLGPAYTRGEQTGELVTTATEGVERLDPYISGYVPQVVLTVAIPLLIAGALLPVDWITSLLLVGTVPIIPILMILIGSHAEAHVQRQWATLSRLSARFLDALQGLPTTLLLGREGDQRARLAAASERYRASTVQVLRVASLSGAALELMTSLAIGLIAVALAIRLIDGGVTFQRALIVFFLTPEFYRPLRELGVHYHAGKEGAAAARRIGEILDATPPVQTAHTGPKRLEAPFRVTVSGVGYTYPGSSRPAMRDVTLFLPANTCTAVVGRSGAGKSTLVDLLLRFIDPASGVIEVNGVPLSNLSPAEWHRHVAFVPQRPHLFAGTILDNLRLARPEADMPQVEAAARLAGVAPFVEQLPNHYQTTLGERGVGLSAGELQRLAVARAFLKDVPFLILDEPTSSLDPESEIVVQDALRVLMHGRTVLVVAHRLNTVARADQIAVLEGGRIVETGTHDGLLSRNAVYAELVRAGLPAGLEAAG